MPFDGVTLKGMEVRQLRKELLAELRKPQPDWDFRVSWNCAIGITCRLDSKLAMDANSVANGLGISGHWNIFTSPRTHGVSRLNKVTPLMVADRLEALFADHPC